MNLHERFAGQGLEVVYITASGGTVTRKASWTNQQLLEPGRHLLLANALGIWAARKLEPYLP